MTASTRRKSRELAMQMLFQADVGKQTPAQVSATFWMAGDKVEPEVKGFAEDLFRAATREPGKKSTNSFPPTQSTGGWNACPQLIATWSAWR